MRKNVFILLLAAIVVVPACRAEARWCDVTAHGNSDKIVYPPIARAAQISGTVLARVTYSLAGEVKDVTSISGPRFLSTSVTTQLKAWHFETNASGNEPCQSLAIIDFRIAFQTSSPVSSPQPISGSIFRVSVVAEPIVLYTISDPAPKKIWKRKRFFLF